MKKEIILDLHGVIFERIDSMVAQAAIKKYGYVESAKIGACYALKCGREYVGDKLGQIVYDCTKQAGVKPGALDALYDLTRMPDTTVHVCSRGSFPEYAEKMEDFYRNMAPGLADVAHYELLSPYDAKNAYISNVNAHNCGGVIYVVDDTPRNLSMAHMLRLNPVLISDIPARWRQARNEFCAYTFGNLVEFKDFLARKK